MSELVLRPRRGQGCVLLPANERLVLAAEREWLVEGPEAMLDAIARAAPEWAERLARGVLLLSFRNSVGRFTLPGIGEIELVSGKITEADFDAMLHELTEVAASLPFAGKIGSGLPYERVALPERHVPFHAFVYLRHSLSETAPDEDRFDLAIARILRQPHHRRRSEERLVPVGSAKNVETPGLLRALTSPWRWQRAEVESPMAHTLRGHLPDRIEETVREPDFDTPENRFVLATLKLAHRLIEETRVRASSWEASLFRERILADCAWMSRILNPLERHPFWREVGPMVHFPAASTVLQRRYGYREVLRHFVRIRSVSRIPLDERASIDLLALKDIATLYELWCFFAVAARLRACLGPPTAADTLESDFEQVSAPRGMRIAWREGVELFYNASFRRSSKSRRSTSVPLRPDIALRIPSGQHRGWHIFDAKFRLDLRAFDEDDEAAASTFKREDLYKMHTYRDAIVGAASVWILYPGEEKRFFPAEVDAPDGGRRGVGAIPTMPGRVELDEVLRELVSR